MPLNGYTICALNSSENSVLILANSPFYENSVPDKFILSEDWYKSLAEMIDLVGDDNFCEALSSLCEAITGYNSTVMIALTENQKPTLLYSNLTPADELRTISAYFDGAYLLDPFYDLYKAGASDGVYRLNEIAPDDFLETEYYKRYFKKTRIIDETGILVRLNADITLGVSFSLREGSPPRELKIQDLRKTFPIFSSVAQQHWSREIQLTPLLEVGHSNGQFGNTLDAAFRNFGKEYLTDRECEIVKLILKGYASKSIAELLEISVDTVKVHRKHFHGKLSVASQAELFSLFIEAISMVPSGVERDPLYYYYLSQQPQ